MTEAANNKSRNILFLAAVIIGITLRLVLRTHSSLWEDEVIATTHAVQPFWQVIIDTLANDIHPPLYFLQLHIWSLLSRTDAGFIINSILLGLLAIASLYIVLKRLEGRETALAGAALFAVLPAAIWMSEEVRMYAWLSVLLIWMFYFVRRVFATPSPKTIDRLTAILLAVAIIYSHAIGFVSIIFYGIYAASLLATKPASQRDWLTWLGLFGAMGILALPILASDLLHPADMAPLTDIAGFGEWIGSVITGAGAETDLGLRSAGAAAYAAICIGGTVLKKTRRLTLCFLILPIAFCVVTGIALRPIFKTNFFSTFLSPFFAMVIAGLVLQKPIPKPVLRMALTACLLMILAIMAIANRIDLNSRNTYYPDAVARIKADLEPGDIIWIPQTDIFEGIAWYMIGPDWGSPLDIHTPIRPQSHWQKVLSWLGPDRAAKLHLIPTSQAVTTASGTELIIGMGSEPRAEQAKRVWLIMYGPRDDLPADLPMRKLGPLPMETFFLCPPLRVTLYGK